MSMTVTDANAANALLNYVLGIRAPYDTRTDQELCDAARVAAVRLADSANKRLSAGLTGRAVEAAWETAEFGPWRDEPPPASAVPSPPS